MKMEAAPESGAVAAVGYGRADGQDAVVSSREDVAAPGADEVHMEWTVGRPSVRDCEPVEASAGAVAAKGVARHSASAPASAADAAAGLDAEGALSDELSQLAVRASSLVGKRVLVSCWIARTGRTLLSVTAPHVRTGQSALAQLGAW